MLTSFAAETRALFGHRTFHQQNDERDGEYHDGEQPKAIEISQRRCLLVTQVLQRLPRQLLRCGRISGLLKETPLSLLKERLYGRIERIEGAESALILRGVRNGDVDFSAKAGRLFMAVGREPNLDYLSDRMKQNMDDLRGKKIFYLAGDVKNGIFRQAAISVGDGIRCAMEIGRYFLEESMDEDYRSQ